MSKAALELVSEPARAARMNRFTAFAALADLCPDAAPPFTLRISTNALASLLGVTDDQAGEMMREMLAAALLYVESGEGTDAPVYRLVF